MAGRILKGVGWSAVQQFSTQGIQFIVTVFLARLLTPSEFGIVAVSMIALNILQVINETGFGAALMQKLDRDETDFSSVFFLNIGLGLFLYGILFLSAPLLAIAFKEPELPNVLRLLGLNVIINSFVVVQRTKLLIDVDFKTWAKASIIAVTISGVLGIFLATQNFGVYALVVQSLTSSFITTLLIWVMAKWHPQWIISKTRLKSLFQFAYKLILARLLNTIFNEIYSTVVGIIYSPALLALFNRAKSFETMSSNNIVGIVQRVSTPILCENQKSKADLSKVLEKFISGTALIVFPLLVWLIVLAKPLVIFLLTEKWEESAWMLQIICLGGFFYVINSFNLNLFNATGKTGWALKCEVYKKILAVVIIAIVVVLKDFTALVWCQVIISLSDYLIGSIYVKKQIGLNWIDQLKPLVRFIGASSLIGVIIYASTFWIETNGMKVLIGTLVGLFSYCFLSYTLNLANCRDKFNFNNICRKKVKDS